MEKKDKELTHLYLYPLPAPPADSDPTKFLAEHLNAQEKDLQFYKLKRIRKTDKRVLSGNIGVQLKQDSEIDTIRNIKEYNAHLEQKIKRSVDALLVFQTELQKQHSLSEKLKNELNSLQEQSTMLKEEVYASQKEANYWKRCYEAQRWTSPRGITEEKKDYEDFYFSPREGCGQVNPFFSEYIF